MAVIDVSLRTSLAEHGWAHVPAPGFLATAERDPWAAARALVGDALVLVETHTIEPHPRGRSYASTAREAPLHTDSQSHRGVPPNLQVLICDRPAAQGGESRMIDAWALVDRIALADPVLHAGLFEHPRHLPFVFGDVIGPTLALRGHALVFSHPPMPVDDPIGRALAPWIAAAPVSERALAAGDVLIVDNHRMLHGRRAFADERRRLLRLLIWTDAPSLAPAHLLGPARAVRERIARVLAHEQVALREAVIGPEPEPRDHRLEIVLAVLRGASPGQLAVQHGVAEPEIHRWRDACLRAARAALEQLEAREPNDAALDRVRQLLHGSPRAHRSS